jgi:hypothetical protein
MELRPSGNPPICQADGERPTEKNRIMDNQQLLSLYESLTEPERHYVWVRAEEEYGAWPTFLRSRRRRVGLVIAAFCAMAVWNSRIESINKQRQEDSFVVRYLHEHSKEASGLPSLMDEAERQYDRLLENERAEAADSEHED